MSDQILPWRLAEQTVSATAVDICRLRYRVTNNNSRFPGCLCRTVCDAVWCYLTARTKYRVLMKETDTCKINCIGKLPCSNTEIFFFVFTVFGCCFCLFVLWVFLLFFFFMFCFSCLLFCLCRGVHFIHISLYLPFRALDLAIIKNHLYFYGICWYHALRVQIVSLFLGCCSCSSSGVEAVVDVVQVIISLVRFPCCYCCALSAGAGVTGVACEDLRG